MPGEAPRSTGEATGEEPNKTGRSPGGETAPPGRTRPPGTIVGGIPPKLNSDGLTLVFQVLCGLGSAIVLLLGSKHDSDKRNLFLYGHDGLQILDAGPCHHPKVLTTRASTSERESEAWTRGNGIRTELGWAEMDVGACLG
jgi:hypothetical protein